MTSINKKRKAKNSYIHNGYEKGDGKCKRLFYYTARQRKKENRRVSDEKY